MSLINQMLRDLDERRASRGGEGDLPNEVRPLPKPVPSAWPRLLGFFVLTLLVLGGGSFAWQRYGSALLPMLASVPSEPAPVASPLPTPQVPPPVVEPLAVDAAVSAASLASETPAAETLPIAPDAPVVSPALSPVAPPPSSEALQNPASTVLATPANNDVKVRLDSAPTQDAKTRVSEKTVLVKPAAPDTQKPPKKEVPLAGVPEAKSAALPEQAPVNGIKTATPKSNTEKSERHVETPLIKKTDPLALPRDRVETLYRTAITAVNQGRAAEAQDGLRTALQLDARHIAARQLLINLLLESGQIEPATVVLQVGLEVQPTQSSWAMSLARLQVDQSNLNGALQTLEHSLPAAANNAAYYGFLGHVQQRLKLYRESISAYQKSTALAPGDGRWWLGLGLGFEGEGMTTEAKEAFLRARQAANLSPQLLQLIEQKLR